MEKLAGIAASLCVAVACLATPVPAAPSCPDVDSAQSMLLKAAAAKNEQDLKQMPRNVPPGGPPQPGQKAQPTQKGQKGPQKQGKAQPGAQPQPAQPAPPEGAQQENEAPPNVETAPVPEDLKRAALLVKQADDACQAGNNAEASEKAKAAMALMKR